jgi:ParB family chromosome partitioning protein
MAKTKNLREALLGNSKSAIDAGRSAVAGVAEGSGAVWLPLVDVAPDPDQPRTHYDEDAMRQLCESIASLGQIEPILVQALAAADRPAHGGKRYRCLSGHRRLRAHETLGLTEIKATVVRERLTDADRFRHEIASNEVREDHTDFDRARFMTHLFADALGADGDEGARAERVKYLVNRAFNEFDRTGKFSAESAGVVDACERALAALGERRNLRWYHRWGLPVLALRGSALEAAAGGLDARRVLAIARLAARSAEGPDADARDRLVARVARAARDLDTPSRDLAAAVKTIAEHLDAGALTDERVDEILASLDRDMAVVSATAAPAKPAKTARPGSAKATALAERARALSERWAVFGPARKGKGSAAPVGEVIASLEASDPRGAARLVTLLERADAELRAALARRDKPAGARRRS